MIHNISDKYGLLIHHISDTHGFHNEIKVDLNTDVVVHSGDATNHRESVFNFHELEKFLDWYSGVPIPIKIYVPGNHDSFIASHIKDSSRMFRDAGIELLNKESITLNNLKIYGDPMTPNYGGWYFMTDRSKIAKHWGLIPTDTDVLVTHGPPKGILDMGLHRNELEFCGDSALGKAIKKIPSIKLNCFGHIHNHKDIVNTGIRIIDEVYYSNAACVKDGDITGLRSNGNFFQF